MRYADVERSHCAEMIELEYGLFIDAWKQR